MNDNDKCSSIYIYNIMLLYFNFCKYIFYRMMDWILVLLHQKYYGFIFVEL